MGRRSRSSRPLFEALSTHRLRSHLPARKAMASAGSGGQAGDDADCGRARPAGPPPYAPGTPIEGGVECYICGSRYLGTSWLKLMTHLQTRHKVSTSEMKGTWLYSEAMNQKMEVQHERRRLSRASAASPAEGDGSAASAAQTPPTTSPAAVAATTAAATAGESAASRAQQTT